MGKQHFLNFLKHATYWGWQAICACATGAYSLSLFGLLSFGSILFGLQHSLSASLCTKSLCIVSNTLVSSRRACCLLFFFSPTIFIITIRWNISLCTVLWLLDAYHVRIRWPFHFVFLLLVFVQFCIARLFDSYCVRIKWPACFTYLYVT